VTKTVSIRDEQRLHTNKSLPIKVYEDGFECLSDAPMVFLTIFTPLTCSYGYSAEPLAVLKLADVTVKGRF
jgi:hypothetical protein